MVEGISCRQQYFSSDGIEVRLFVCKDHVVKSDENRSLSALLRCHRRRFSMQTRFFLQKESFFLIRIAL